MQRFPTYAASFGLAALTLLAPLTTLAQSVSETGTTGDYSVTLKVLPAESFTGTDAEMARDGGAMANEIGGSAHPNHHLVVFVQQADTAVAHATVSILYRKAGDQGMDWTTLPVARMHVNGKGPETTHFGNNLYLDAGKYEARVIVDGSAPVLFKFSVPATSPSTPPTTRGSSASPCLEG